MFRRKNLNLFEPASQILHLVWPRSAPACFKLVIISGSLKIKFLAHFLSNFGSKLQFSAQFFKIIIIPPQQINTPVFPHKSGSVQVLHQHLSPNLALVLARPVFELEKCYLDENWSESNQEFIGVLRPGLACLVSKLR